MVQRGKPLSNRQKIIFSVVILVLVNLLLVIVFGDNGLVDYFLLRNERDRLIHKNEALSRKNLALYREIDRLKNDLKFVENVARQELGMIGKNEMIIKLEEKAEADK
jgi:cell division protein FtsB